jgi:NitT/TauT family transport system substrate-binding protein
MEVTEMPEALHEGKIDAFAAWEPTPFITVKQYPETVIIHKSLSSGYMYFKREFFDKHPEIVRLFLAAEIRAINWMSKEKRNLHLTAKWAIDESENISGKRIELSEEEAAKLALKDILEVASIPHIPGKYLKDGGSLYMEFSFLKTIKKIPPSSKWEKVRDSFNNEELESVSANPVKYRINEFQYDTEEKNN